MADENFKVAGIRSGSITRLALVEDNPLDSRLISAMLLDGGHQHLMISVVCGRLSEILGFLKKGLEVDAMLLDLSLPDSTGIETFRWVFREAPHLPIIVLSGYDDEALATQTVHEGAQDYLVKNDLTDRLLVRSIAYAVERKKSQVALQQAREELESRVLERTKSLEEANGRLANTLSELSSARGRMIQAERLHALERMASGIAHDFNNALSPILAHTEWLVKKRESMSDPEKLTQTLFKIHYAATHCAEVVSRLREFCRPRDEMAQFTTVELGPILTDVISMTQTYWKDQALARGVTIQMIENFGPVPKIVGSRAELREMFTNLILNAIDAMTQSGEIQVNAFEEDGFACVQICDCGVGMSSEVGARCMEPFFTTKQGQGSGLGLGVVYGIAQRHEAEINIESELWVGTNVTVRFPMHNSVAHTIHLPPVYGLRILAAEDDPAIREILGAYLREDAHSVEMVVDGKEALNRLGKECFDLIITDYSMPGLSGDRVAAAARASDRNARVMMLTGFGDMLEESGEINGRVSTLISKPFTFESLRNGIALAMANAI